MGAVSAPEVVALSVAVIACVTDLRARRIPNLLTGLAILMAAVFFASTVGVAAGLSRMAAGFLAGLIAFFPFFALGGLGAGDVKLMAALGSWVGWKTIGWTALYAAVAGGVMAVVVAIAHGYLRQAISNIGGLFLFWSVQGLKPLPGLTLEHGKGPRLPYAIPIFVGLVTALWKH